MTESGSSLNSIADRLASADEEARRLAVAELAASQLSESCSYLFRAMADTSWRVRKEAVGVFLAAPDSTRFAPGVLELLRSVDNAGLRNAAAEVLERIGRDALPLLHGSMADPDGDVRKFIIDILGGIGSAPSAPFLVDALSDEDSNVRLAAAESLGKIGCHDTVPPLLACLAEEDVAFRHTILIALAKIGVPVPLEVITPLCAEPFLQRAVYECLGATGDETACAAVLSGLQDPSKTVRESAVRALANLDRRLSPAGIAPACSGRLRQFAGSPVVDGLLEVLGSADDEVQAGLIRILGMIGDARAAGAILRSCHNERLVPQCILALRQLQTVNTSFFTREYAAADDGERATILRICGELGSDDLTDLIQRGLADPVPQVREIALRVIGLRGMTGLAEECAALLRDCDSAMQHLALETLIRLAGRDGTAVGVIANRLVGGDAARRRDAACLFGALAGRQHLAQLLKDEDDQVRRAAVRGIALLDGDDVVHLLSLACTDEIADVRIAAAAALGETASKEAVEPLLTALADVDPWVRCAALRSLGTLGSIPSLPAIRERLADDNELVGIAALEALGQFPSELSRELVCSAAQSKNGDVVRVAVDILAGWDDPWLDDHAEQLLEHRSWGVRSAAIRFLAQSRGPEAVPMLRFALEREKDDLVRTRIAELLDRFQC